MPISVIPAGDHLFVRLYGVVTAADFLHYAQEAEAFEQHSEHALDRITDMTGVERFAVSHRDVFELADRRKRQPMVGSAKAAIIATEPIQIGLARMYQTMTEKPNLDIRIFHSLAEAREWLGLPAEAAAHSTALAHED